MAEMLNTKKLFTKKAFIAYSLIVIGAFIMAAGYVFFISPNKIVPGGVFGISIVVHHLTKGIFDFAPDGIPVGFTGLILNIPLTIIGIKVLGPRFGVKTIIGLVLTSVFIDFITFFYGDKPLVDDDVLLSAVFGGVMIGVGLGMIFKARATSGGSDIVAMIVTKYTKVPVGQALMYVDSAIVLLGLLAFGDWKIPLYSLVTIFITAKVIDIVIAGFASEKTLFIISEKQEEIRNFIVHELNRGGTFIKGQGIYKGNERTILYTVLNRKELGVLQDFISQTDPNAFMSVIDANEILGEGFKSIKEKVSN